MPNQNSLLVDLSQALREAASDFCNMAERNNGTADPNDVAKVRDMIQASLLPLDDTPIFIDRVSTKTFLASKVIDRE